MDDDKVMSSIKESIEKLLDGGLSVELLKEYVEKKKKEAEENELARPS